jgi:hypothetical protein
MRGSRLNGWQRTGIVLSVLWVSCPSMWFIQQIPAHHPAITSIYRQCIQGPSASSTGVHSQRCKILTFVPLPTAAWNVIPKRDML